MRVVGAVGTATATAAGLVPGIAYDGSTAGRLGEVPVAVRSRGSREVTLPVPGRGSGFTG
ncbi:hypothetical protein [Streptomyces sp. NPDC058307]|uniref:hypothetical protein n=1 Tax=Streptomyces sp. NPDC058307 TaxID=3346439 RepID=UPI0036F0F611